MMTIYHNPRCRKSREALQWLNDKGYKPEIIEYLKTPLGPDDLGALLELLGMEPEALIRKNEPVWKEQFRGREMNRAALLKAMSEHPKLIERPIVVMGKKAVVARPADRIEELLDN